MTPEQIEQIRPRLVEFTAQMLTGAVGRSDQRVKGELYVRGLLTEGARKSMQPMAARLGVDHQQLQQFVTSSTWDHVEVRRRVAQWAETAISPNVAKNVATNVITITEVVIGRSARGGCDTASIGGFYAKRGPAPQ